MYNLVRHLDAVFRSRSLKGTLLRGVVGSAGIKAANVLLGLALAILLARSLGPAGYGVYAFALSLVNLLAVPAQVGLPQLLVREVAKYRYQGEWHLLRGLLRRSNQIAIAFSFALATGGAAVAMILSTRADLRTLETFLWALPLIPLIALGNLRGAALRGLKCVIQGQVSELILRPGFLLLLAGTALWFGVLSPSSAIALHALAAGLAFGIASVLLVRYLPTQVAAATPVYETRVWLRSMLPLSLLAGMQIVNNQIDIVLLSVLTTSEEVGIYRATTQASRLIIFFLIAVNVVIAPYISQLYASGDMERLQRLVTTSARAILAATLPAALSLIIFGEGILKVAFGPEYAPGHIPLAILSAGQLINAAAGSVGLLLNMSGHERDTARGFAVATIINVVLNVLLIPRFGIAGAAIATAASLAIWNILLCRQAWVRIGIQSTAIRFPIVKPKL